VPAGAAFMLKVVNNEKSGVEIEAKDLKIEKVAAAGTEIIARVKPIKPGKYLLVNEYKEDTVKAYIVAE
jgi:cupredoxin-like protein